MDDFASDESQNDDEFFTTVVQQQNYYEKVQNECGHYEHVVKELRKEISERDTTLKKLQNEIEHLQMDILYNDLKIEKVQNVYEELRDTSEDQPHLDPQEKIEAISRLENQVTKNLKKYINRIYYSKKQEFDEKQEKLHHQYSAVCVKYYKDDPTNEDYGIFNAQNYSYHVFGLSNDLTFGKLFNLAKVHWNFDNVTEYVLTDPDHHDLALLMDVPIAQFLSHETHGYAMFILRKKNTTMKELVTSQKASISLIQETEKQGKITEEYKKIFDTLRKAKPGIYTYELSSDDHESSIHNSEGSIFNFLGLISVLILFVLCFVSNPIKPSDQQMLNTFSAAFTVPRSMDSNNEFTGFIRELLFDVNQNNTLEYLHYVPIGKKRFIMNKMFNRRCVDYLGTQVCAFEDKFTEDNLDTTPLQNGEQGPWMNYQKIEGKKKLNIKGRSSKFDGSGFIYDFPLNITENQMDDILNNVLWRYNNGDYFATNARAYIFHSLLFEPNRQIFIDRTILFEFTAAGVIDLTEKKTYFKPYTSEHSEDNLHFRIIIALLAVTIFVYFFSLVRQIIRTKSFKLLLNIHNLIKYITVGLVITSFVLFYQQPDESTDDIVTSQEFETLQSYGDDRALAANLLALAFIIHCLTIIRSFVFSKTVNLFLNIFAASYKDFAAYFIIFISCLVSFSFVWWIVYSPYDDFLATLFTTAFELFQFFGTGEILVIEYVFLMNQTWAVLLVILTCLIIFIQLDSLMTSIIIENVRYLYLKRKLSENLFFKRSLQKFFLKVSKVVRNIKEIFKKSPHNKKSAKNGKKLIIT